MKYGPSCMFPSRKNNFYVPPNDQQRREISGGLEVWRGFFSSIRPYDTLLLCVTASQLNYSNGRGIGQLYLNFDTAAGCFKQSGSLITAALKFLGRRDPRDLVLSRMPPREKTKVSRFIKNSQVKLSVSRDPNAQLLVSVLQEQQ